MHDERIDELLPIYALGALDGDDLVVVEAHVAAGCSRCARELVSWEDATAGLAEVAPMAHPPARLRERVLRAVEAGDQRGAAPASLEEARQRRLDRKETWAGGLGLLVAAALLIVASGAAVAYLSMSLREASGEIHVQVRQLAALEAKVKEQDRALADRERQLQVVRDPYVRIAQLSAKGASGEVLWSPTHMRGLMFARGLEKMPPEKTYELWLIADGKPMPAGTFNVGDDGMAVLELPEIPEGTRPDAFGVTIERAGGATTPTLPIILQGAYPKG